MFAGVPGVGARAVAWVHVAIVERGAARALLRGAKRIETRFYRQRRAPWGRIAAGDTVHFKLSGGRVIGSTPVAAVRQFADLTPATIARLRRRYGPHVNAPLRYWAARRDCRYGVLIWLGSLTAPAREMAVPRQYGGGWLVLGER